MNRVTVHERPAWGAGAVLALLALAGCRATAVDPERPDSKPADLVLLHARVVTMDPSRPVVEALAVSAGQFLAVGSSAALRPLIGPKTRVIDAAGATVIPGLIDAHLHLFGEGFRLLRLDLVGTTSKEQILERVKGDAARLPDGAWLRGRGWDQNDWPDTSFPSAADLDRIVPDRPVALTRVDGHALWVNSRALDLAGIGADTANPEGGKILRDPEGRPSGVLVDNAVDLVTARIPEPTRAEKAEAARRAAAACVAKGLTGVHEPGVGIEEIEILKELYQAHAMPLRVYAMVNPGPALDRYLASGPEIGRFEQRLTVRAVKLYADGALGSRGAALLADYADEPGNQGLLLTPPAELEQTVKRALGAGMQPCIHAIGDRANREMLGVFERAFESAAGRRGARPRIEHAQFIAEADLARFVSLDVIASMQPTHATSDMPWVGERLGALRTQYLYAWNSLLRAGARVAFGSDAPVESVDPLLGIYAATTRADRDGHPVGGWLAEERVTPEQALAAFTTGAAYAAFEEDEKGSIAPGKLADFVLLSADPLSVAAERLATIRVLATYVAGVPVYEAEPR